MHTVNAFRSGIGRFSALVLTAAAPAPATQATPLCMQRLHYWRCPGLRGILFSCIPLRCIATHSDRMRMLRLETALIAWETLDGPFASEPNNDGVNGRRALEGATASSGAMHVLTVGRREHR